MLGEILSQGEALRISMDAAVALVVFMLVLRMRRGPDLNALDGRCARLEDLRNDLRLLVAQAEAQALDLDERLRAHASHISGLLAASSRRVASSGEASQGDWQPGIGANCPEENPVFSAPAPAIERELRQALARKSRSATAAGA